jgi:hypothetical protein
VTPDGIHRLLAYMAQKDAELALRFDLERLGPGSESFGYGWPNLLEWPLPWPDLHRLHCGN